MTSETKNKPVFKASLSGISLNVWKDEKTKAKTVQIQKSYKDKEGEWKNPNITLFPHEFATLTSLLIHYRVKVLDQLAYTETE